MEKKYSSDASGAGHGGMDWFCDECFLLKLTSVSESNATWMCMTTQVWAAITCLSEQSIAQGGEPQGISGFYGW
jgi:hypothetical protein